MAVTADEARAQLLPLIAQVNEDQEVVEIIGGTDSIYLVPEAEYRSWLETLYLLTHPANAARLADSMTEYRAGQVSQHDRPGPGVG